MFLLTWLIIWAVVWVPCFLWFRRGATYINKSIFFSLYFLVASAIPLLIFKKYLLPTVHFGSHFPLWPFVVSYGIILLSYALAPRFFQRPDKLIAKSPSEYFIYLDFRTVLPKTLEVMFQQIMVVALTIRLSQMGYSIGTIIAAFAIFFGVVHLGMFKTDGKFWGSFFTIAAIISAFIFPVLILKFEYGFVYSFIAHLLFYIPTGVLFWIYQPKI